MAASKVKFTCPDPFMGDYKLLRIWLFRMNEYTELCGITISTKKIKIAVLGLESAVFNVVGVSPNRTMGSAGHV